MNRSTKIVAALGTTLTLATTGAVTANAAPTAPHRTTAKLDKSDVRFLKSNEQVNLAEIDLGKIILSRSRGSHARQLARVTMHDHRKAMRAVEAVAKKDGVSLPDRPNRAQRKLAERLSTIKHHLALTYFKAQIAGHDASIKQTDAEIANGSKHNVIAYAKYYLPIAEKHLRMSEKDLHRLQNKS